MSRERRTPPQPTAAPASESHCAGTGCPQAATELGRRAFLELTAGAAVGSLLLPTLPSCEIAEIRGEPPPSGFELDLANPSFQVLTSVGGLLAVDAGTRRFMLIRTSDTEIVALDRLCTHQACDMDPTRSGAWRPGAMELECRCHGAFFDAQGAVISGPAPRPLPRYPVTFDSATGMGSVDLS